LPLLCSPFSFSPLRCASAERYFAIAADARHAASAAVDAAAALLADTSAPAAGFSSMRELRACYKAPLLRLPLRCWLAIIDDTGADAS
jgi:hypothetical protein